MSCKTNRGQETHTVAEDHTNRDTAGIIKQEANGKMAKIKQINQLLLFLRKHRGR